MKKKIVVFATSFLDELPTHPEGEGNAVRILADTAGRNSFEIEYRCSRNPNDELSISELEGVSAVIADLEKYDSVLLKNLAKGYGGSLELIARYGIGYNSVDIKAASDCGVIVTNTPGANARPTAEWTVATLLDIAGRRNPHHERARGGLPKSGPSRLDVYGKTLGLIGAGNIGKHVVSLLKGFNMNVLVADPFPDQAWAASSGVSYSDMRTVCETADFISLHASSSEMLIGKKEISLMNPLTALINCARGILVDNRAAYDAVKNGKIWGYGIDEIWPFPDLPIDGLNIVTSPHVGSDTDQGKLQMQLMSAQSVADFFDGKPQKNRVA